MDVKKYLIGELVGVDEMEKVGGGFDFDVKAGVNGIAYVGALFIPCPGLQRFIKGFLTITFAH